MNGDYAAKNADDLNRPVTLGVLLEYTDDFLIPKMVELIDERLDVKLAPISAFLEGLAGGE